MTLFLIWVLIPHVVAAENFGTDYGYVSRDFSDILPICVASNTNDSCRMVNKTVDFADGRLNGTQALVANTVDTVLSLFHLFDAGQNASSCKESARDYMCSQVPICDGYSFGMDAARKKRACFRGRETCNEEAKRNLGITFDDCENITEMVHDMRLKCMQPPNLKMCPYIPYMQVQDAGVAMDVSIIETQIEYQLRMLEMVLSPECTKAYNKIYCSALTPKICSDDGKAVIDVYSRQECEEVARKCAPKSGFIDAEMLAAVCPSLADNTSRKVKILSRILLRPLLPSSYNDKTTSAMQTTPETTSYSDNGKNSVQPLFHGTVLVTLNMLFYTILTSSFPAVAF